MYEYIENMSDVYYVMKDLGAPDLYEKYAKEIDQIYSKRDQHNKRVYRSMVRQLYDKCIDGYVERMLK